jgi:hypothetical protein
MARDPEHPMSVAAKKDTTMAAKWTPLRRPFIVSLSLLLGGVVAERPGGVKGAPLFGAAQRTLDGEDRSEMIEEVGKACETLAKSGPLFWYSGPPPPTTSDTQRRDEDGGLRY